MQTCFPFSSPKRVSTLAAFHTSESQLTLRCLVAPVLCCPKMTKNGVKTDIVLLSGK